MNYIYKIYGDDRKKGVRFLALKENEEEVNDFINQMDAEIYYKAIVIKYDVVDMIPEVSILKYLKNALELKQAAEKEKWQREFKARIKRKSEEFKRSCKN